MLHNTLQAAHRLGQLSLFRVERAEGQERAGNGRGVGGGREDGGGRGGWGWGGEGGAGDSGQGRGVERWERRAVKDGQATGEGEGEGEEGRRSLPGVGF